MKVKERQDILPTTQDRSLFDEEQKKKSKENKRERIYIQDCDWCI